MHISGYEVVYLSLKIKVYLLDLIDSRLFSTSYYYSHRYLYYLEIYDITCDYYYNNKDLGILFDTKLTFNKQIETLSIKGYRLLRYI